MTHRISGLLPILLALLAGTVGIALAAPGGDATGDAGTKTEKVEAADTVDINRAGTAELQSLPGIGPSLAARIIAYRDENGPFERVEQLLAVRGIGPKLLARLKDRVSVGSTTRTGS